MICGKCGFENPDHHLFCGMCGVKFGITCQSCGHINPKDYRFCGNCGVALEKSTEPSRTGIEVEPSVHAIQPLQQEGRDVISGEKRIATILIVDVVGSTQILEIIGTEKWVALMHQVLHIIEEEIFRFGGEVYQFRGDGLISFFGRRHAHEDDTERAIHAALSSQKSLHEFSNKATMETGGQAISIRAGVSTGEIIITRLGGNQTAHDDTLGSGVSQAALMENSARPGTVWVSEQAYALVQNRFIWQEQVEVQNPGGTLRIKAYQADQPTHEIGPQPDRYSSTSIIGREQEYQILVDELDQIFEGKGYIVSLIAEKGMGKSTLIEQARNHFNRQAFLMERTQHDRQAQDPVWFQSRCRSYNQIVPYSLWTDILEQWLDTSPEATEEFRYHHLEELCESIWAEESIEYFPYLAKFLSLPLKQELFKKIEFLDPDGLKRQIFISIQNWLKAIARIHPLVLSLIDLQWVDSSSFELLMHCIDVCQSEKISWLLSYRPDKNPQITGLDKYLRDQHNQNYIPIFLSPLPKDKIILVVQSILGGYPIPNDILNLIADNAEGNPYYARELINSLLSKGLLVQDDIAKNWMLTQNIKNISLPVSLQALFLSRLDQMSPEHKAVLQMAAVIGMDFWSNVLIALTTVKVAAIPQILEELEKEKIIIEQEIVPDLGTHYIFSSNLMRDTAYDNLLGQQKKEFHRKIAEFLENTLNIEFFSQHFGLIAYHYSQAGISNKELFYILQFAEQVQKLHANREALSLYNRALELISNLLHDEPTHENLRSLKETQFEIYRERIKTSAIIGVNDFRNQDAAELLRLADEMSDSPAWTIDAILNQPGVMYWQDREECLAGKELTLRALELSRAVEDHHREIACLESLTRQFIYLGDLEWQETGSQALRLARMIGDQEVEARLLLLLGSNYSWSNQPEIGLNYLRDAEPLAEALNNRILQVELLRTMGFFVERSGNYHQALLEYWERGLRISREIGYRKGEVSAMIRCGQTQAINLGDFEGGITWLEAARMMAAENQEFFIIDLRLLQILMMEGNLAEAHKVMGSLRHYDERNLTYNNRASFLLLQAQFINLSGCEPITFHQSIDFTLRIGEMLAVNPLMSRQYAIAALSLEANTYLQLATCSQSIQEQKELHQKALLSSRQSLQMLENTGFIQIMEWTSEHIYFVHARTLEECGLIDDANRYYEIAHAEMMRKHQLIPEGNMFRDTFMEIWIHQQIREKFSSI